jgi:hypothetical protein
MSSIFEYKLVPYKENDYSYISKKNKKDFTSFELFRILVIAIATKFFVVDKPARIYGATYKMRNPLPDEKEWNAYLQKIPVFYIKDILLKIKFHDDIINLANNISTNSLISQKIDQNLFNSLGSHIPLILLTGINYCVITNDKFYSEIFLEKLKKSENTIKGYIKTKNLGAPPGAPGKNIKNFEVNKHRNHITTTNIIPLIYLIYSYIYIKYYKNIKCKKIFVQSKLDYELYNNVFSHKNPVIKKVNIYLNDILGIQDESKNNKNINNKSKESENNELKNNFNKNIIEDINNGVIKDKMIDTINFIDTKIDIYDNSEKNIKIINNVIRLLKLCEKNIDLIKTRIEDSIKAPRLVLIAGRKYNTIAKINDTLIIKDFLEDYSPIANPTEFKKYKDDYNFILKYYQDIIKNISEVNKYLLDFEINKDSDVSVPVHKISIIIKNFENEIFSKNIITDGLIKLLDINLKEYETSKKEYTEIKNYNNDIINNLKNQKEIIHNIFDSNYNNKSKLIDEYQNKKKNLYKNITNIFLKIDEATFKNHQKNQINKRNSSTKSTVTSHKIFNCLSSTNNNFNNKSICGEDIDDILEFTFDANTSEFNKLLIYIYKSFTLYEYYEFLYLNRSNNQNINTKHRQNEINSYKLDFEEEFRKFQNNDKKKYEDEIKKLETKKEFYISIKDNAEYELKKYNEKQIDNKIEELTKNDTNKLNEGEKIKILIDKINKLKKDKPKAIRDFRRAVFDLGKENDKRTFDSKLPDEKTGAFSTGITEDDSFNYLISCLQDKLDDLKYVNILNKKKNIESKRKNKQNSLKNKDLDKPLSKQRLNNIDDILSYIDKNIAIIQSKKNSNSSNKTDIKSKFVTIFTTLYKYCNDIEGIKKKIDFDIINNKIYFYFTQDKKLKALSNIEISNLKKSNANNLKICSKIKNLIKKIEYDKQKNDKISNLYKDDVKKLLDQSKHTNFDHDLTNASTSSPPGGKNYLLQELNKELTDLNFDSKIKAKSNIEGTSNTIIKLLNSYYIENKDKDKFINYIYDDFLNGKKPFSNDDVKTFFDKYKDFCENLSNTIIKLLNHIDKNNIKKFSYNDDIFDELIQEKNKKICTILDKTNNNIDSKNGKYIRILAYTDIFHVYIMIFLIFIDYLNYYYFCELDIGTRTQ